MDDLLAFDSDLGARFDHPAGGPGDLVLSVEWGEVGAGRAGPWAPSRAKTLFFSLAVKPALRPLCSVHQGWPGRHHWRSRLRVILMPVLGRTSAIGALGG